MSDTGAAPAADPSTNNGDATLVLPFPSLPALHASHLDLIRRQREGGTPPEFLTDVSAFIQRGSATGVLLDADADRETAQGLLDYWATIFYRAGYEPPDATLAEFDPDLAPVLDDALCPYVGLDAFREADYAIFFGRQRMIDEIVERLREHRLVAVIGPSGSGKSSVVSAGVIPARRDGALPGSEQWHAYPPIVPGATPLASLARLFAPPDAAPGWADEQVAQLQRERAHLAELVEQAGGGTVVLCVDQFEEVFTLCEDEHERDAFIGNLLNLIDRPGAQHSVILTMRSDFEAFVAREPALQERFAEGRVTATPLSAAELREAIERPALKVGLKFEDGVIDALLHDLLGEPAALPLLQFTLLKLWEHRSRNRVTKEAYQRLGGGRLALARSADEFYAGLIPEEQVTARRILLRMIRPGEGLEVTSNRIRRSALYRENEARDRIDRVLEKLIRARLVRTSGGDTPGDEQIEVAHEALVRNWPTLVDWLEDERSALSVRRRLETKAAEWVRLGRGNSGLLDREQLREAEHWLASSEAEYLGFDPTLPELVVFSRAAIEEAEQEQELARQRELEQARALAEEQQRRAEAERLRAETETRTAKRLTWMFRALAILALIAFASAILAISQAVKAVSASREAVDRATDLQTAIANANTANAVAVQNAQVADQNRQIAEKNAQVAQTNLAAAQTAEATANDLRNKEAQRRRGERAELLAAVAQAVMPSRPQLSLLLGVEGYRVQHDEQPPEASLPSVLDSLTKTLVQLGAPTRGLPGHAGKITAVSISADGARMLSGDDQGAVRYWDLTADRPADQPITLPGTGAPIVAVAFTPDRKLLIAAGNDGTIHVWGSDGQAAPRDLAGPPNPSHMVVSPDGAWLAVSGASAQPYLWRLANPDAAPLKLTGHTQNITDVAFSGDSRLIMTSSADGTAKLYNLAASSPERPSGFVFARQNSPELSAAVLSQDGRWAVTAASDGALHVWTVANNGFSRGPQILNAGTVTTLAIDPASRWVVVGGGDGRLRLWRLGGGTTPQFTLAGHTGPITAISFSADGSRMASSSADGTALIWNLGSPADPPRALRAHEGSVNALALSADGARLATGGDDKLARDWDLAAAPPAADNLPQDAVALAALACRSAGRDLTPDEWAQYFPGQQARKTCGEYSNHHSIERYDRSSFSSYRIQIRN
jgi:WD40 repeat protein